MCGSHTITVSLLQLICGGQGQGGTPPALLEHSARHNRSTDTPARAGQMLTAVRSCCVSSTAPTQQGRPPTLSFVTASSAVAQGTMAVRLLTHCPHLNMHCAGHTSERRPEALDCISTEAGSGVAAE